VKYWRRLLELLGLRRRPTTIAPPSIAELEALNVAGDDQPEVIWHPPPANGLGVELADDLEAITLRLPEGMRFDQKQREQKRRRKWWHRAG